MVEPKTLAGFMELLPQDQVLFNKVKSVIQKNYEKYGFLPLDTPVLESSDVLLAKAGGETEKQIYSFKKGDNDLCMRFDLTVPLAKYVALNYNNLNFPFSRYQIGKVYRGERPQKGRFREFYQCDIDVVGREKLSPYYEAEIPSIMYNVFKDLNIGDFVIKISNRKILLGLLKSIELEDKSVDILRLVDKFDKIGQENVKLTLKDDFKLNDEKIKAILDFILISGAKIDQIAKLKNLQIKNDIFEQGIMELETVVNAMRVFGVSDENFEINLTIARGLDYYTGTVYETFIKGHEDLGSICSGGRYDNLAGFYTDAKLPGVGMSIGLTRLFYQLKQNEMLKNENCAIAKVIVIPMGETLNESIALSTNLRRNGINTEIYLEETKFKNKIAYASKQNIPYAVIVGEDEVKNNYFTLKNLITFEQQQINMDELIKILK